MSRLAPIGGPGHASASISGCLGQPCCLGGYPVPEASANRPIDRGIDPPDCPQSCTASCQSRAARSIRSPSAINPGRRGQPNERPSIPGCDSGRTLMFPERISGNETPFRAVASRDESGQVGSQTVSNFCRKSKHGNQLQGQSGSSRQIGRARTLGGIRSTPGPALEFDLSPPRSHPIRHLAARGAAPPGRRPVPRALLRPGVLRRDGPDRLGQACRLQLQPAR